MHAFLPWQLEHNMSLQESKRKEKKEEEKQPGGTRLTWQKGGNLPYPTITKQTCILSSS